MALVLACRLQPKLFSRWGPTSLCLSKIRELRFGTVPYCVLRTLGWFCRELVGRVWSQIKRTPKRRHALSVGFRWPTRFVKGNYCQLRRCGANLTRLVWLSHSFAFWILGFLPQLRSACVWCSVAATSSHNFSFNMRAGVRFPAWGTEVWACILSLSLT